MTRPSEFRPAAICVDCRRADGRDATGRTGEPGRTYWCPGCSRMWPGQAAPVGVGLPAATLAAMTVVWALVLSWLVHDHGGLVVAVFVAQSATLTLQLALVVGRVLARRSVEAPEVPQ